MAEEQNPQQTAATGMFNLAGLMDAFYGWQPGEDDAAGNALKNTFATEMIQAAFDTEMAKDLAYANQEIASNAMTQAADLESRNQALVMKDEFDYGLEYEIEKTTRSFKVGSKQQEHNLIDALKICCRKFSKEKTGKKPFTNINLVRI